MGEETETSTQERGTIPTSPPAENKDQADPREIIKDTDERTDTQENIPDNNIPEINAQTDRQKNNLNFTINTETNEVKKRKKNKEEIPPTNVKGRIEFYMKKFPPPQPSSPVPSPSTTQVLSPRYPRYPRNPDDNSPIIESFAQGAPTCASDSQ